MSELNHRVKVSVGYTRNMGNFESLRVDIGCEVDGNGQNPNETFEKAYQWAETKLIAKIDEVEKDIRGVTGREAD